jgi:hypothetical protein
VLKCKPIGVLEVVQTSMGKKERIDRVFVVRRAGNSIQSSARSHWQNLCLRSRVAKI